MVKAKQTHCGQYKRYGDSFYVWEIETEGETENEVLEYCFRELYRRRLPESAEWHKNIRHGTGEKSNDANYYFAGYYTLSKTQTGYEFKICNPYTD